MPVAVNPVSIDVDGTPVSALWQRPDAATAALVLAPGAGSGKEHPFLAGFADAIADAGIATLRFDFPYREAGRRFPDRPPVAIAAWRAAVACAGGLADGVPVWAGGKSFGGRMASMAVADGMSVAGLVFLGYPLHPPGRPEKLRDEHLYGISVPMLFVQGSNDPFSSGDLLAGIVARIGGDAVLEERPGAGHSFEVAGSKRHQGVIGADLAAPVAAFISAHSAD